MLEVIGPETPAALSLAAGMCGRIAGDLGASVTRVIAKSCEPIDRASDIFLNSGKTCISVAQNQFEALTASLMAKADCTVVDAATLGGKKTNKEETVVVAMGMTAQTPTEGTEFTIEARSGLLDLVGDPQRQPLRLGGHQVAYAAGLAAYLAIVSALPRRIKGQPLSVLHLNLLDIAVWLNWKTLAVAARTGQAPTRKGPNSEWSALKCEDGYIAAVYRAKDWNALKAAFNDPRLDDPQIQTAKGRSENRSKVNELLSAVFQSFSRAQIHDLALSNKLPLGPVWGTEELRKSAHLVDRNFVATIKSREGQFSVPTLPVKWSGQTFLPNERPPQTAEAMARQQKESAQ